MNKELWNLDYTLTQFILPRLLAFRKMKRYSYPNEFKSIKEWNRVLDKIIMAFEIMEKDEEYFMKKSDMDKVNCGLELFAKHFRSLWD